VLVRLDHVAEFLVYQNQNQFAVSTYSRTTIEKYREHQKAEPVLPRALPHKDLNDWTRALGITGVCRSCGGIGSNDFEWPFALRFSGFPFFTSSLRLDQAWWGST